MSVDFGKTAVDYSRHRSGFPEEFFWELRTMGIGLPDQKVLDLATGTGSVARGLALGGAKVDAIDIASPLLEQAAALDRELGVAITYRQASAEQLPYPAAHFDVITAGQSWHWFDRARAAGEAFRVLKPGGRLVIAHFDWLPIAGTVVAGTERLIEKHNPEWRMGGATGFYPQWCEGLLLQGFADLRSRSFDKAISYSHERWRGRIRASAGIAASLSPAGVAAFDRELAALLAERFPADPLDIPHRVWMLVCVKPYGAQ